MTSDLLSAQRYSLAAVVRIVGAQDAEDVLQEAALCAWKKRAQFRNAAKFETWFWRIATHQAIYWLRRNKRRLSEAELSDYLADTLPAENETQEEFVDRLAREQRLYAAIMKLNRRRKLAALRWLAGKTARGAEKAARHKAKVELREMLS